MKTPESEIFKTRKFQINFSFQRTLENFVPFELWIPLAQTTPYQEISALEITSSSQRQVVSSENEFQAPLFYAQWSEGPTAMLQLQYQLTIHPRRMPSLLQQPLQLSPQERDLYTLARPHVPTDGVVIQMATEITRGLTSTLDKALAIYDWLIQHGERDPNQVGCGLGHVKDALLDQHVCGRCVDISSVMVALLRAANIPAREMFGLRLGPSLWSKGLGRSGIVSESQHCKIEFFSEYHGWVVCDPGDVLKLMLDEGFELDSSRFQEVRQQLFGQAESNWLALNSARDFMLRPTTGLRENYLMYPIGQCLGDRLSPYTPEKFGFQIVSTELT